MGRKPKHERPFAFIRRERGMTLDQAAYRMRITPGYLRALELGRSPLCYMLACEMARVYQCGLMQLRLLDPLQALPPMVEQPKPARGRRPRES